MKRKEIGGDELQTRVRVTGGEPLPSFWEVIETQIAECASVIRDHSIDCEEDQLSDFADLLNEHSEIKAAPYTDLWYAAELGWRCLNLWLDRDQQQSDLQLGRIMQIGMLGTEWNWRTRYKPAILTGQKVRKTLGDHRKKANDQSSEPMRKRQAKIKKLLLETNLKDSKDAVLIPWLRTQLGLEKHGEIIVSTRTIRRDLKALKKL